MRYQDVYNRFKDDTANHVMKVLHDDNGYRHLRFSKPSSSSYWFDVVTWPGFLTITGDMGSDIYSRESDMLGFFEKSSDEKYVINPHYWSEKLQTGRSDAKEYSLDKFKSYVAQMLHDYFDDNLHEIKSELEEQEDLSSEVFEQKAKELDLLYLRFIQKITDYFDEDAFSMDSAYRALSDFSLKDFIDENDEFNVFLDANFSFSDIEGNWEDYTFHYLWRCFAVVHATKQYAELKKESEKSEAI